MSTSPIYLLWKIKICHSANTEVSSLEILSSFSLSLSLHFFNISVSVLFELQILEIILWFFVLLLKWSTGSWFKEVCNNGGYELSQYILGPHLGFPLLSSSWSGCIHLHHLTSHFTSSSFNKVRLLVFFICLKLLAKNWKFKFTLNCALFIWYVVRYLDCEFMIMFCLNLCLLLFIWFHVTVSFLNVLTR